MSTHSMIAFDNGINITSIYCHFDGYLEGVGMTLVNYWNDIEKVKALMELGDLSVLGTEIGQKQNFNNPTNKAWCLSYSRDRNETEAKAVTSVNIYDAEINNKYVNYYYLFDGVQWTYKPARTKGSYIPVAKIKELA